MSGCFHFRCKQPMDELKRVDPAFEWDAIPFLPNAIKDSNPKKEIINMVAKYDLVIIQRCYIYDVMKVFREACDFAGKPLIFETDDDYLNLPAHNPCYYGMVPPDVGEKYNKLTKDSPLDERIAVVTEVERFRLLGLEKYKEMLKLPDALTVSTTELRNTLYPYNKNITVFENQVERVYEHRDNELENKYVYLDEVTQKYKVRVPYTSGLMSVPSWVITDEKFKTVKEIPRIGYTGTPSHRGKDFDTIKKYFNSFLQKYGKDVWTLYIGDRHFFDEQMYGEGRGYFVGPAPYDTYIQNIRNLDVGLAPIEPNIFNMAKSDVKGLEYSSWGACPVLPNYITYNRNFKHEENCLMYSNEAEFYECLERLLKDRKLMKDIGNNAREYVKKKRLERHHSERRYQFYKELVTSSVPLRIF